MINVFVDLQTLHNYSIRALGRFGERFMNQQQPELSGQTPLSFYSENPSIENFKKIIELIEKKCSQYN